MGDAAVVLGCPSIMINPDPHLGRKIEERFKGPFRCIGVAAGHPDFKDHYKIERSLIKLLEDTGGAYITQSTWELLAASRGESHLIPAEFLARYQHYLKPDLSENDFLKWLQRYSVSFYDVPSWIEYLHRFDIVIGTRIHGIFLAIQAGVPGICVAYDSRIRELCEISHIPYVLARDVRGGFDLEELRSRIHFDGAGFDHNRACLRKEYHKFFQNNHLVP
jgi:hypothetical protein